jgi:hypothetical protein
MTLNEAEYFPKLEVESTPEMEVELRIICWKAQNVVGSEVMDLYSKFYMEGEKPQTTDTHWRAKMGKASWNYRMKFKVTLPIKPEFARLHCELWDKVRRVSWFCLQISQENCLLNFLLPNSFQWALNFLRFPRRFPFGFPSVSLRPPFGLLFGPPSISFFGLLFGLPFGLCRTSH